MNLVYKKILGKFTKVLGFGKTPPPPCWEKFPNNIVFFCMRAYLKYICYVTFFLIYHIFVCVAKLSFSNFLFWIVEFGPQQLLWAGEPINFTATAKSCQHFQLWGLDEGKNRILKLWVWNKENTDRVRNDNTNLFALQKHFFVFLSRMVQVFTVLYSYRVDQKDVP